MSAASGKPRTPAEEFLLRAAAAGTMVLTPRHEPSYWLRERAAELLRRAAAGELTLCRHLRVGDPALIRLWADHEALCGLCMYRRPRLTGAADRTCDRCGVVVPDGARAMFPALAAAGPVVILLGLCGRCNEREVAR